MKSNGQGQFVDVICFNRYFGWYSDTGHSELITYQMVREVTSWHDKYRKPGKSINNQTKNLKFGFFQSNRKRSPLPSPTPQNEKRMKKKRTERIG